MVVRGFVGTYDDNPTDPIRGNGKSMSMSYFGYKLTLDGWECYSNYKTTFSTYLEINDMIDLFMQRGSTFHHCIFLVDEIQTYIDSIGTKGAVLNKFMNMIRQLRKRWSHLYWTSQRYMDVAKRMRIQSDEIFQPVKTHPNRVPCKKDICQKDHYIFVFRVKPFYPDPLACINATAAGRLYNTEEIIIDKVTV